MIVLGDVRGHVRRDITVLCGTAFDQHATHVDPFLSVCQHLFKINFAGIVREKGLMLEVM